MSGEAGPPSRGLHGRLVRPWRRLEGQGERVGSSLLIRRIYARSPAEHGLRLDDNDHI